jgi:hypothetical protein
MMNNLTALLLIPITIIIIGLFTTFKTFWLLLTIYTHIFMDSNFAFNYYFLPSRRYKFSEWLFKPSKGILNTCLESYIYYSYHDIRIADLDINVLTLFRLELIMAIVGILSFMFEPLIYILSTLQIFGTVIYLYSGYMSKSIDFIAFMINLPWLIVPTIMLTMY